MESRAVAEEVCFGMGMHGRTIGSQDTLRERERERERERDRSSFAVFLRTRWMFFPAYCSALCTVR